MSIPNHTRRRLLSPGQLWRKSIDLTYLARDFLKIVTHTGYFHQRELLGGYFVDRRSYYVDFRKKVEWKGKYTQGVPALFLPSSKRYVLFPSMVLQYGLGAVDSFFNTGDKKYLNSVADVYAWMVKGVPTDYSFDNLFAEMNSGVEYFSNNSGMTQGEALSFLSRVVRHDLVKGVSGEAERLMENIYTNMLLPMERGGTAIYEGDDLYFCEYCRRDGQVVLNGWMFAIFGLYDYEKMFHQPEGLSAFQRTVRTLANRARDYMIPRNNWSFYDNKGRVASPTYQLEHICLMDAMYRLTSIDAFRDIHHQLMAGNTMFNKTRYTLGKVVDKIKDTEVYTR